MGSEKVKMLATDDSIAPEIVSEIKVLYFQWPTQGFNIFNRPNKILTHCRLYNLCTITLLYPFLVAILQYCIIGIMLCDSRDVQYVYHSKLYANLSSEIKHLPIIICAGWGQTRRIRKHFWVSAYGELYAAFDYLPNRYAQAQRMDCSYSVLHSIWNSNKVRVRLLQRIDSYLQRDAIKSR